MPQAKDGGFPFFQPYASPFYGFLLSPLGPLGWCRWLIRYERNHPGVESNERGDEVDMVEALGSLVSGKKETAAGVGFGLWHGIASLIGQAAGLS
jgi:hypothetical protein